MFSLPPLARATPTFWAQERYHLNSYFRDPFTLSKRASIQEILPATDSSHLGPCPRVIGVVRKRVLPIEQAR